MKAIFAKNIYTPNGIVQSGYILYENEMIQAITTAKPDCEIEDFGDYSVIPGLIDIHIHGTFGHDTMDATPIALQEISKSLAKHGVTGFLPTTLTHDFENIKAAVNNVSKVMGTTTGAEIIGSYVEGPYLTPEHRGAHPVKYMREVTIEEIDQLIEASNGTMKVLVIAPEKENAIEAIKYLRQKGIHVSMGHTNADYDTVNFAIENGAEIAVHTFNGMRGFTHRDPGALGAFLTNDNNYCEIICDLHHAHPGAIKLLYKAKHSEKILLISDSMIAADLPDGDYKLGTLEVKVTDGVARTLETGSLAGSTTNMMDCVKNAQKVLGLPLEKVLPMATINQAKLLGIDDQVGTIEPGKKLNIAIIDEQHDVKATLVNGKVAYIKERTAL